jgi:intracellular sulfur oxidation DsrE/DsrF family protein
MTSRARRQIAVMTAIGCLLGLMPVAASGQTFPEERTTAPKSVVAQSTTKSKKESKAKAEKVHKIAIQVAENNPGLMNLALNNAANIVSHYKKLGEKVVVEIVTFGPGLHMLRDDTAHTAVKQRVQQSALETPEIAFYACANTQANMAKQEGKEVKIISEAKITPSGVVRLAELQGQGYAYIRP